MPNVTDTKTVRDHLADIISRAHVRGDEFSVRRRGKTPVAIIPAGEHEAMGRQRAEDCSALPAIWDANAAVDPAQVIAGVEQAVAEALAAKRKSAKS